MCLEGVLVKYVLGVVFIVVWVWLCLIMCLFWCGFRLGVVFVVDVVFVLLCGFRLLFILCFVLVGCGVVF